MSKLFRILYWKILKIVPRGLKDSLKDFISRIKIQLKRIRDRFPFLLYPIMFFKVRFLIKSDNFKGIIVYPPTVDWSWMKQRPHQLMEGLAERGYLCFYVNINHKNETGKRYFRKITDNLYVIGNPFVLYQIEKPILLVGWTEHYKIINKFKNPKLIYDYLDDLNVSAEKIYREKLEHHKYFLKQSNLVLVTADRLKTDAQRYRKDILFLPNAGNYDDFHFTKKPNIPIDLKEIVNSNKKIIGYYGALARWFDYKLVKKIAEKRPNYEIVLIGPDYDDSIHAHKLDKIKNIHWLGLKKYYDLPKYLYYFDVAMIPFVVNDITKATSPVKIFEYMAGSKLTVSTPLDECKKYKSVLIGKDSDDFINKLDQAIKLKNDPKIITTLDKEAKENTWEKRLSLIDKELERIINVCS